MKHFYENEFNKTVETINKLKTDGCLCFNLITDSHIFSFTEPEPSGHMYNFENVEALNSAVDIDCLFHLGDLMWFMQNYWTEEKSVAFLTEARDNLIACNKTCYFVPGNHDGTDSHPPVENQWYKIFVEYQKDTLSSFKENKPYYSVDFKEQQTRFIVLMACYQENENNCYGWFEEQINWLTDTLLSTPDNYKIILMTHINPIDGDKRCANKDEFINYLNAYADSKEFKSSAFSADFTNKSTAKIILMLAGHTHYDRIVNQTVLPFPVIERACNRLHEINKGDGWGEREGGFSPRRTAETDTADLWDTVIYNPEKSTMDIIRFGAGEDLHIKL